MHPVCVTLAFNACSQAFRPGKDGNSEDKEQGDAHGGLGLDSLPVGSPGLMEPRDKDGEKDHGGNIANHEIEHPRDG
ncbi:MAG: hypothetical protein ACKODZ_10130, partial [Verrucomicrobiota bacterium]